MTANKSPLESSRRENFTNTACTVEGSIPLTGKINCMRMEPNLLEKTWNASRSAPVSARNLNARQGIKNRLRTYRH